MIVRTWRGWVNTDRLDEYVDYVDRTGLAGYRQTPGNLGAEMWTRDLADGRSEVTTVSWWESLDVIRAFAGDDIDRAVFYPEDDEYLIDREVTVHHHVLARRVGVSNPQPAAARCGPVGCTAAPA
jgi:heme-degrading monooxygenase HmoA